jgi:ribonuclease PH
MLIRQGARLAHAIREVTFTPNVTRSADGSCAIKAGNTHILCTARLDTDDIGLHVSFGKLPTSEYPRISRESVASSFETRDIQKAIHQSVSVALGCDVLKKVGIYLDCDVLESEGAIKTSCVSGGFVAAALALSKWKTLLPSKLSLISPVAGISCGIIKGEMVIDLDHQEAEQAEVIGDFMCSSDEQIVGMDLNVQRYPVSLSVIEDMSKMALRGVKQILAAQKLCLSSNSMSVRGS